jgi:glutathione S-transferase
VLKLYYVPRTRSIRPRWLLEELGVPYELVRLDPSKGETRQEPYLKINPLGHVPALDDGGTVIAESAAIIMHLADRFPEKGLAPKPGTPERAQYYQWIVYAMVSLESQVNAVADQSRIPEDQRQPQVVERARARFHEAAQVVETHLKGRQFIVGQAFTAADLVMSAVLGWGKLNGLLDEQRFPTCLSYWKAMLDRPAAQKARAD